MTSATLLLRELARHARAIVLRWRARLSRRPAGLVLVYHGVAAETGDRRTEIIPPIGRRAFEGHVRHLARHYEIVAPSTIQAAALRRRRGRRVPVALTFDDDLGSHLDEAAPVLRRAGAPAAFFVCGTSLDAPERFWWEDLQEALDRSVLETSDLAELPAELVQGAVARVDRGRARLAAAVEELSPTARDTVGRALRRRVGEPPRSAGLRRTALQALVATGFEIGFHTLRHDRLPPLDDRALEVALQDGREALEAVVGRRLTAISYPHGRADGRVASFATRLGYIQGFVGGGRVVRPEDDPLLLPRITASSGTHGEFAVAMARLASGRTRP